MSSHTRTKSHHGSRQESRGSIFSVLGVWNDRVRQRDKLATLDARLLNDIGVSRRHQQEEVRKPFWKA